MPPRFGGMPASLLEPVQAYRWFMDHGARHGTGWINRVTRVLPDTPVPYSPVLCAPFVTPPTLMMVAPGDEMAQADYGVARSAHEVMPDPCLLYTSDAADDLLCVDLGGRRI